MTEKLIKLKAVEMNFWRYCRLDRIKNEDARDREINFNIIDTLEANQLKYYEHMQHMADGGLPMNLRLVWIPHQRRKRLAVTCNRIMIMIL